MEIRVLKYFYETARLGNITKAAEYLHTSQPNVSRQIKALEEELDEKLFIRHNFNVELTDEGRLLQKRAEEILDLVDKTYSEFQSLKNITIGEIQIGCAETADFQYLAACIAEIHKHFPGIRFHFTSNLANTTFDQLDKGLLDFGLVLGLEPDLTKYEYIEIPSHNFWGLLFPLSSPLAAKEYIEYSDLLGLPLFCSRKVAAEQLPLWLGSDARKLTIAGSFDLAFNVTFLVSMGLGYAITLQGLPTNDETKNLCFRPFASRIKAPAYFVWRRNQILSPAAKLLLQEVKRQLCSQTQQ